MMVLELKSISVISVTGDEENCLFSPDLFELELILWDGHTAAMNSMVLNLPKHWHLWLILPFGQRRVASIAHFGDKQRMEVSANLQEDFQVAKTWWHLGWHFGGEGNLESKRVRVQDHT